MVFLILISLSFNLHLDKSPATANKTPIARREIGDLYRYSLLGTARHLPVFRLLDLV